MNAASKPDNPGGWLARARRKRIKAAFQRLAKMKAFSEIADPVQWQREIRLDRSLPGRAK